MEVNFESNELLSMYGHDTHFMERGNDSIECNDMRQIGTREVQALTGLSANQLREWTGRRGIVCPDSPAIGKGTRARFAWRTVLVLRVAVVLRTQFHIELQANRDLLAVMRELFEGASFLTLWGRALAIYGPTRCKLLTVRAPLPAEDMILLRLNRHLEGLSQRFGLPDPISQLPPIPGVALRSASGALSERERTKGERR